jgi:hypothetical protein
MLTKRAITIRFKLRDSLLPLTCASALGISALGYGQSMIDIAFNWGGSTPSGAAYWGGASDQWNVFDAYNTTTGGPFTLVDVNGGTTSVDMSYSADGAVKSLNTGTQPDPALTSYYLFNNSSGSIDLDLAGLLPSQAYQLVMYVSSDDALAGDRSLTGSVTGSAAVGFSATGDPQSSFIPGENIVTLSAVSDAAGDLSIVESDGGTNTTGEVDLNGLQIQAVPEPSPVSILALGIVPAITRRRRKSKN